MTAFKRMYARLVPRMVEVMKREALACGEDADRAFAMATDAALAAAVTFAFAKVQDPELWVRLLVERFIAVNRGERTDCQGEALPWPDREPDYDGMAAPVDYTDAARTALMAREAAFREAGVAIQASGDQDALEVVRALQEGARKSRERMFPPVN